MLWILFKVKLDPLAKYNELEVRRPKVNNNCLSFFLFRYGLVRLPNPFFSAGTLSRSILGPVGGGREGGVIWLLVKNGLGMA